jgi:hypothetical protein
MFNLTERVEVFNETVKHNALLASHNTLELSRIEFLRTLLGMGAIWRDSHFSESRRIGILWRIIWNWNGCSNNIDMLLCEKGGTVTGIFNGRPKNNSHWEGDEVHIGGRRPIFWLSWRDYEPRPLLLNNNTELFL